MCFRGEIQKSQAAHDSGLIRPDYLSVARYSTPPVNLETETRLAALHRCNGLKSTTMLGKVQHYAAVLFPELQVHELLSSSSYDRALTLFCRFHFSSALTTAQAKARGGQIIFAYWGSRLGRQFYPTGPDLTLIIFSPEGRIGNFVSAVEIYTLSA
jgi:hypothetical protein